MMTCKSNRLPKIVGIIVHDRWPNQLHGRVVDVRTAVEMYLNNMYSLKDAAVVFEGSTVGCTLFMSQFGKTVYFNSACGNLFSVHTNREEAAQYDENTKNYSFRESHTLSQI